MKRHQNPVREDADCDDSKQSHEGKGKGKQRNFTDRLRDSSTMAVEALASPAARDIQYLSFSSSPKAQSSPAGVSSTMGEASSHTDLDTSSRRNNTASTNSSNNSFRGLPQDHQSTSQAFDAFIGGTHDQVLHEDSLRNQWESTDVRHAEMTDGAAAAKLLCRLDMEDTMIAGEEELDGSLSREAAANLHQTLFGTESPAAHMLWDSVLNFRPEFVTNPEAHIEDAKMHLGTAASPDVASIWYHQWDRVLSNYHDEVWGDLASLVSEARGEVKKLVSDEDAGDQGRSGQTKALDRLRMILTHVRGDS